MAIGWIGISSSHIDSYCGQEATATLADALDGTDSWDHNTAEIHNAVFDLGESQWVTKVRGRSNQNADPIDVNIYVTDDKGDWGGAVATGITSWQGGTAWNEVETTVKLGRYVKVEIIETEDGDPGALIFGDPTISFTIIDVYIGAAPLSKNESRCGFMQIQGAERLRGLRRNSPR